MKRKLNVILLMPVLLVLAGLVMYACRDEMAGKTFLTSDDMMMDDYITQKDNLKDDENLSMEMFLDIVDKADFRGTLHAYGLYSCFVPTNAAIKQYLEERGLSSVSDLTEEECVRIVKYHVIRHDIATANKDEITTSYFVDGKLPWATMLAKYLTARTVNDNGNIVLRINRQANVLTKDIAVANGYIHRVDHVLTPPANTCGEQILELPEEQFSLFKQLMRQTGWADSLTVNRADGDWYTVFLQSDESLLTVGINSIDSLAHYLVDKINLDFDKDTAMIKVLQNAGLDVSPANLDNVLLWIYAAYHTSKGLYYVADLMKLSSIASYAPDQVITFRLNQDTLLANEYVNTVAKQYEAGVPIKKVTESEYSDFSCYNGVLVDVAGYIGPKKRGPQAIFWEITEQPELVKNSDYRRSNISISWDALQTYSEIKATLASGVSSLADDDFRYYVKRYETKWQFVHEDGLGIDWTRFSSLEFTLPMLTPGTYNVWVCFRRADVNSNRVRATFIEEGQEPIEMGTVGFHDYYITGTDAQVLLGQGMKRYNAKVRVTSMNCLRWGTMEVKTTGRHKLRMDVVDRGRGTEMWIDMLQFIPTDHDQLWPRFDIQGNQIQKGTPCNEIAPVDQSNCNSDNDDH